MTVVPAPIAFVIFAAAITSQVAGKIRDETLACVSALVTVHQEGGLAFQEKKEISTFYVAIEHATKPDPTICDTAEQSTGFGQAYCKLPMAAHVEGDTLYGDDDKTFRGYYPWVYFVVFDDGHFLWSSSTIDGVVLRTGTCALEIGPTHYNSPH